MALDLPQQGFVSQVSPLNQTSWDFSVTISSKYYSKSFTKTVNTGEARSFNAYSGWVGTNDRQGKVPYNRTDMFGGAVTTLYYQDTYEYPLPSHVAWPAVGMTCVLNVPQPVAYNHPTLPGAFYNYGLWGYINIYHYPWDGGSWGHIQNPLGSVIAMPNAASAPEALPDQAVRFSLEQAKFQGKTMGIFSEATSLDAVAPQKIDLDIEINGTNAQWPDWTTPLS